MVLLPKPIKRYHGSAALCLTDGAASCFELDEDGGNVRHRFCGWFVSFFEQEEKQQMSSLPRREESSCPTCLREATQGVTLARGFSLSAL